MLIPPTDRQNLSEAQDTPDQPESTELSVVKDFVSDSQLIVNRLLKMSGDFIEADISIAPDYNEMAGFVREISGARYVAVNIIDLTENGYYTRALSGISDFFVLSARFFGFNLLNHKWDHPNDRIELSIKNAVIKFRNLRELVGGSIPGNVVKLIENQFRLGEIVVLSIIRDRKLLGDFVLLFEKGSTIQNEHFAELYAHLVGQFLNRKRMEEMLNQRLSEMERFQKHTVDRELMMIELKKEINELLVKAGNQPKYKIVSETVFKKEINPDL